MKDNSIVNDINKVIKNNGSNQYGDPLFRVVFSDDQLESRRGTFTDTHAGLFVRTVTEIREVKKYPWIKEKWILERWAPGELSYHKDLITVKDGVYICVYVFQDVNQDYLPPLLKVAEIVINNLLNPRTPAEIEEINKKQGEALDKAEVDTIDNEIKIESDEAATKDPNSRRETMSSGYSKEKI